MATTTIGGLEMEDLRNALPLRAKYSGEDLSAVAYWDGAHWRYRQRNKPLDTITIHHTGGGSAWTIEYLARWCVTQIETGRVWYIECPYHFVIEQGGRIGYCIDVSRRAWHCGDENDNAVGVALLGNFDYESLPPAAQLASARRLLAALKTQFPNVGFRPHREMRDHTTATGFCATSCPGQTWPQWRAQVLPDQAPQFDWRALWGDKAPYLSDFGIPTAWREEYLQGRKPGAAKGAEFQCTAQEFERAVILWANGQTWVYYR